MKLDLHASFSAGEIAMISAVPVDCRDCLWPEVTAAASDGELLVLTRGI